MASNIPLVVPTFETLWGAVAILGWMLAVSNGCISMQACTYFRKFSHRDHYILKYTVAYIWFGCVILVLCEFWVKHDMMVVGYYLPSPLVPISLGFPIGLAVGMTVICSVQGVYVLRMYRFNHNRYLLACCCALAGVELGTGFTWVVRVAHAVPAWQNAVVDEEVQWIIMAFFTISMFLDIFIAASTCYQLWRSRMMGLKQTRYLVDKLMRWTIQTGVFTSVVSLVIVLMRNLGKNGGSQCLWLGITIFAPNCYAVGLLALLNARTSLKLGTDHLSMPTAITSPAYAGASRSGILAARSTATGSAQGGMV